MDGILIVETITFSFSVELSRMTGDEKQAKNLQKDLTEEDRCDKILSFKHLI